MNLQKAVFLDRDGVINKEIGHYVFKKSEFEFNSSVRALKLLTEKGYLLIVISNQGGVAKELYTVKEVDDLHQWMSDELKKQQVVITDVYYCPHHPVKTNCLCRKPNSLLLEKAIAKYAIDVSLSYLIGDQDRDVEAAERVGLKGLKIEPNADLTEVVNRIINGI
jgi:D-glycero-D-manno-heptose 1,7-bisphosphate phosphatase